MRITGKGTKVKLFDDKGKEIIAVARIVIMLPGRNIIITPNSQLREAIRAKQAPFIADVYETTQNGKGYVCVRNPETGKFRIVEIKGNADVVIER